MMRPPIRSLPVDPVKASYNVLYKLVVEIEVNCLADAFYCMFKHNCKEIPRCLPHIYEKVEHLEGDENSVGCTKRWDYVLKEGDKSLSLKERMTVGDDQKRIRTFSIFEGEVMNDYKLFDVTLAVTPKDKSGDDHSGDVSVVSWCVEYVKAHDDAPVPFAYIDCLERVAKDLATYLQAHPEAAQAPTH